MSEVKGTKALELWCKRLIKDCPNVQIDNMTTSWRNGIAFCALVHHFRPDLIDVSSLKPENIYENNQQAFSIAEKHLGIPALLDPEDMVENEVPDRLSILTYLSQFYQRLGHTVNTKASENESKTPEPPSTSTAAAPFKFGKTGLDKCAACGLPVYLAQRLIVSHKLYHRRCFRCSKCSGHLNPKNFQVIEGSEFCCDSCKNEKTMPTFLNNNDQIGMLAFHEDLSKPNELPSEEPIVPKHKTRPQSILEKISLFEKQSDKEVSLEDKLVNMSLSDNLDSKLKDSTPSVLNTNKLQSQAAENMETVVDNSGAKEDSELFKQSPEKVYKSNINKFNFLQTQLAEDTNGDGDNQYTVGDTEIQHEKFNNSKDDNEISDSGFKEKFDSTESVRKDESNMTDDIRLAKNHFNSPPETDCSPTETNETSMIEPQISISVPPRKKKNLTPSGKSTEVKKENSEKKLATKLYPDHLNPFSDDEEEEEASKETSKPASTNPFGSSDEEDDDVPPIHPPRLPTEQTSTPTKRLIAANPFWSDGEEPSSDDEPHNGSTNMYKSSLTTSTPNLPSGRRKKVKAPPPPVLKVTEVPATSMDDVASISSLSSYTSTVHSDQKSYGMSTPRLKKKRMAPTPPDSMSMSCCGSMEKGVDHSDLRNNSDGGRRLKGPAPGLPLPERREVKMQMSPEELQVQLDMLETQQLGLERQGVLIEQMIRDKCEGEDAVPAPQEEVEDLVIQLCELVNEKNDLFRKQTELMYIRRQQRLEQEQADIEHEIRVIQSRPAVNRIDADKAREEQLVSRLVQIVRMRDELVQQIDAERRRERQEDMAIACSIATKRAQRNSDSNSSSMKSTEVVPTPKKNKVKDKVKKQLKKAKHTLISKKKDESDKKEAKPEKEKKSKQ
ncbi:MICAL-like protein 1 [Leguminivora glycinivorella]|uniref:MICAL-like protein 1 n=1 Tax=Leguminivora glycinivorella TaxID=1035111 RepID=UPI00200E8DE0|nr:MICAL-like protein 1 [Leguminivora glycinivorella]